MATHIILPRRTIVVLCSVLIAAVIATLGYIRLPHATILISPATHTREITQEITLSTQATAPDFVRYILPAKFAEKEVTESKTITRAGTKTFEDFARGIVKMVNTQPEEQRLLPKTHLRHEATGVFFLTDTAVVIPPAGTVTIAITAKEKGPAGNIAPGKLVVDKLPESFRDVVYAENTTPFTGGVNVETPLTEQEISTAKQEVYQAAKEKAEAELSTAAGGASAPPQLTTIETVVEEVSAEPGSQATQFTVRYQLRARGFFPDENDLLSLTLLALRSSPAADEEFISYEPDSFKLEIIRSDFARGEARVKGTLTGNFAQKTGPTLFEADNLAGRTAAEVQEYFKQFPSVGQVEVKFSPFWVSTVPSRPAATEIIVQSQSNTP